MTADFVPGLELARLYYTEAVRPVLDERFPGLRHCAALIGPGSEVLGFDTPRSTDHDWGLRLQLFLPDDAADAGLAAEVSALLTSRLAAEFRGYPTSFARSADPARRPVLQITVAGLRSWLISRLGVNPLLPIGLPDWLALPGQLLAEVTGGAVFHDGLARPGPGLDVARARLSWYPRDIWLYVMAAQWQRISQEEPFPGRCAEVGDEVGSMVVVARLVRDVMRLVLLVQRRYPPYGKWLGSAFARTVAGAAMLPQLSVALSAATWPDRERGLCAAYESAARLHNGLGLTAALDPVVRPTFYDRPYRVLEADRFVQALRGQIRDERVRSLPLDGVVDQFIDSTDGLGNQALRHAAIAALTGPR